MRFLDPDQRWDRQVRDICGIPPHGKHAHAGTLGGGCKIPKCCSARLDVGQAPKHRDGRHRNAREVQEIRERRGAAVIEGRLQASAALRFESRAAYLQRDPLDCAQRPQRMQAGGCDA